MEGRRDTYIDFSPEDATGNEAAYLLGDDPFGSPIMPLPFNDTIINVESLPDESSPESDELVGESSCLSVTSNITKKSAIYVVAGIASAPTALNAFAAPSGQGPEHISTAWWNAMSLFRQIYSVSSGISSEVVNTVMNALFIPVAWQKLRESLAGFRKLSTATQGSIAILLSLGAAVAAGAIAYTSFLWLPVSQLAVLPTIVSFVITFAGRFISVRSIFSRIRTLLSKDGRLQKLFADKLSHIHETHFNEVETRLERIIQTKFPEKNLDEPLSETEYQELIVILAEMLDELNNQHENLIQDATAREAALRYLFLMVDVVTAVSIMAPTFMTYTQKGFDGVNIVTKMISGKSLDGINPFAKVAIGTAPGIPSAMFFAAGGIDFRANMAELFRHVYQSPRSILAMLGLFTVNGIACNSMSSLAQSAISRPDNIFGLANNAYGTTYLTLQTAGGFITNMNSCTVKAFLTSPDPVARDVNVQHLIKRTKGEDHPITSETANALRRFNLFAPQQAHNTHVQPQNNALEFNPNV